MDGRREAMMGRVARGEGIRIEGNMCPAKWRCNGKMGRFSVSGGGYPGVDFLPLALRTDLSKIT